MKEKKDFFRSVFYGTFGVLTVALFLPLMIWAGLGVTNGEIPEIKTSLVCDEEARSEYLVGQDFDPAGISLSVGSRSVAAEDCDITYDFSSAGNRQVRVSYNDGGEKIYYASMNVSVYFVRALKVLRAPESVTVNEDGTFSCDENFTLSAVLDRTPADSERFAPAEGGGVILSPEMYRALAVESKQTAGFYTASVYCGNLSYSFNFYNDAGRTFLVRSERNVISFETETDGSLTLVVTDAPDSYQHTGTGRSEGFYVYTSADGEKEVLPFGYELTETEQKFSSAGLTERAAADEYAVDYRGQTFTAGANVWQSGVVNGAIVQDGEFLFVVENEQRTLEFGRPEGAEDDGATLKVYVTYYEFNMSTGSGYATGFYVYTDTDGTKYKLNYYFQTWTWDHVPLSIDHQDGRYPNCRVNVDYLIQKYVGNIQTQIGIDGRTETFEAKFEDIRYATYNTH